jgi:prolyl-tRNA synthetase
MGGSEAEEFMYLNPIGEDTIVLCDACGYAQNRQIARAAKPVPAPETPRPVERVATPETTTIERLCSLLGVPPERTAKVIFMTTSDGRLVVAVVRGDMQLNETKLATVVQAAELRPMTPAEIQAVGCVAGYGSPIGVGDRALVVVDESAAESPNLVAGANEEGWHLLNTNVGRDYEADRIADIAAVDEGYPCVTCGSPLRATRGVEVGNIFKLGTHFSVPLGANYLDEDGTEKPIVMGSYGIGVGRLFACIAEEHHDDRGLLWPPAIAPFTVHVCALGPEGLAAADGIVESLEAAGIDVLLDDRGERPGVQFTDAELIGCPIRLTVSKRSLEAGGIEVSLRADASGGREIVPNETAAEWVTSHLGS